MVISALSPHVENKILKLKHLESHTGKKNKVIIFPKISCFQEEPLQGFLTTDDAILDQVLLKDLYPRYWSAGHDRPMWVYSTYFGS